MLPAIGTFRNRYPELRYFLAPMAGITDLVFRSLMREMGAQIVISELISAEGLVRGGKRTWELIAFTEVERPVGIQLFGSNANSLSEAAKIVEAKGADFVDLNLGCPVKKVICDGAGAAWLKDLPNLARVLTQMKSGIAIPLTIKVRTGWDEKSINVDQLIRVARDAGVAWVAIHGRTRAQGYSGEADWNLIREVAQQSPLPIVGNGDIHSAAEAINKIEQGYSHAIMIGRGALRNPWIFREISNWGKSEHPSERGPLPDFPQLIERHFDLAFEKKDRTRAFLSLKKFMSWYATGLPNATKFRATLFQLQEASDLRALALDYFGSVDFGLREETREPFLMGGHG